MGGPDLYEPFTENIDDLYKRLKEEWGACIGKMWVDDEYGNPQQVGWVFQKIMKYEEDKPETYLHETWIVIHEEVPEEEIKYHYREF